MLACRMPPPCHAVGCPPAGHTPAAVPRADLQVGIPSSREQYIHRLGRTARAGRTGRGLLVLMPEEQHFLRQLRGECRTAGALSRAPACAKLLAAG